MASNKKTPQSKTPKEPKEGKPKVEEEVQEEPKVEILAEDKGENAPNPNAKAFKSKDRLTCTALDALGNTPVKVERLVEGGTKPVLYYHFSAEAWEHWDKYRRGEKLMVSIRAYEDAEKRFKNNLYEGYTRS